MLGTRRSLSVFDLLTMKLVWSIQGSFGAFSVARSDAHALKLGTAGEAWIAAACTVKSRSPTEDGTDGEASGVSELDELMDVSGEGAAAAAGEGSSEVSFKVVLFGLSSKKPLASCASPSKINSMVFTRDSEVLCNTENSEVLSISPAGSATTATTVAAQVSRKVLPSLTSKGGLIPETEEEQEEGVMDVVHSSDSIARPHVHANKAWLNGIFDASSENIPSLSVVCGKCFEL